MDNVIATVMYNNKCNVSLCVALYFSNKTPYLVDCCIYEGVFERVKGQGVGPVTPKTNTSFEKF